MKLINLNSKKGVVNLFADFILNKFDKSLYTVIEVFDFKHFYIINGVTESKIVLDLSELKKEFISKYNDLLVYLGHKLEFNLMDLIQYDNDKIKKQSKFWFEYYDSERPIYHHKILNFKFDSPKIYSIDFDTYTKIEYEFGTELNNNLYNFSEFSVKSEFPHGHSLNSGRKLFYYGEYISYNIKNSFICNKITLNLSESKDENDEQSIKVLVDLIYDRDVKSMILDNFDFNLDLFQSNLLNYNFCDDLIKPNESKIWLKKNIDKKDLILI